jgi:hypothetical protein
VSLAPLPLVLTEEPHEDLLRVLLRAALGGGGMPMAVARRVLLQAHGESTLLAAVFAVADEIALDRRERGSIPGISEETPLPAASSGEGL